MEFKTIEIGEFKYTMRHAPASVALRATATLANGLAPLVNGFRRGKGGDLDRVLLGVAETCADPALAANLEALCNAFKPYTQVIFPDGRSLALGGDRGIFEEHFAGRLDALITWLRAAVEYDLGGFLDDVKAKLKAARDAAKAASETASKSESPNPAATTG